MYASRPAREGEQYQTTRFASGSIGVTVPKDGTTAICIACDTRLEIEGIPQAVMENCGVKRRETVTFSSLPYGGYRDAVTFENGPAGFAPATGGRRARQRRAAGHSRNPAGTDCRTRLTAVGVKQAANARGCLLCMHFCLIFIHIAH
jgi:hypothetical protein